MASKSARRRAARARGSGRLTMEYAKMQPSGNGNWVEGFQQVLLTGQVFGGLGTPNLVPTWAPNSAGTILNSGAPVTFQAVTIPALLPTAGTVNMAVPTIGRVRINKIVGNLQFSTFTTAGDYAFSVGIYVSGFTVNTSAWDVSNPGLSGDALRDNYFFLKSYQRIMPVDASATAMCTADCELSISEPIIIGAGQAVHVTVCVSGPSSPTCTVCPAFRSHVEAIT